MVHLYSERTAKRAIDRESAVIRQVADKYHIPPSWIQAILLKEMTELNLLDLAADLMVYFNHLRFLVTGGRMSRRSSFFGKLDSSTGWGQIFGFVAINALNRAVDQKLTDYTQQGFADDHRLSVDNPQDLWLVWHRLNRDRAFNIEMCALNLLACAEKMNGHTNLSAFTEEETKRTFTRYNADVRHVTRYGEETNEYHREYQKREQ